MSYYGALQIKGLQSYKPSKFTKNRDGPGPQSSIAILAESDQAILMIFDCKLTSFQSSQRRGTDPGPQSSIGILAESDQAILMIFDYEL